MRRTSTVLVFFPLAFSLFFLTPTTQFLLIFALIDYFVIPIGLQSNFQFYLSLCGMLVIICYIFYYTNKTDYLRPDEEDKNIFILMITSVPKVVLNFFSIVFELLSTGDIDEYKKFYWAEDKDKDLRKLELNIRNIYLSQELKTFYILGFIVFEFLIFNLFIEPWLLDESTGLIGDYYFYFQESFSLFIKSIFYFIVILLFLFFYLKIYLIIDQIKLKKFKKTFARIHSYGFNVIVDPQPKNGIFSLGFINKNKNFESENNIKLIVYEDFTYAYKNNDLFNKIGIVIQPNIFGLNVYGFYDYILEIEKIYEHNWSATYRIIKNLSDFSS